ncbi:MAG TPA: FtsX-like permease family protein, partial [Cyclobacteriaceae bacterium]|nr:FtsX-like permease family protein [Cyclobacteriaceae bacterium]
FLSQENREDFNLGFADDWNTNIITYIKLTPSASPKKASVVLNNIVKINQPQTASSRTIELDPLEDYYRLTNRGAVNKMINSLLVIMVFILVLAIVNFVNITTAASLSRMKEIGMRKAIGCIKRQVVAQFLLEAVIVAFLSGILALCSYQLLHGYIGEVLNEPLPGLNNLPIVFWLFVVLGLFLVGLMAGLYPAIWLSSTKTLDSLKGKLRSMNGTIGISRGLIAIQFSVAVFVFVANLIISQQVSYFSGIDLGYDKSNVLIVSSLPRLWNAEGFNKMETAKTEFESCNAVKSVSLSWGAPNYNFDPFSAKIYREGHGVLATLSATDHNYADVYGLNVIDGKFFFDNDDNYVPNRLVINESMQQALSLHVGDKVRMQFSENEFTIAGIVKDFHFESLHAKVKPVAFTHTHDFQAYRYFSFKLHPGGLVSSIREIEDKWHKVFPNDPFDYAFTDERFPIIYKTEFQLRKASMIGGVVILCIVFTGVLGLVSLQVTKRSKEIGIRKVLGAPTHAIINLISHEYVVLMILAFMVSVPLSYFFCQRWLSDFAYHIELTWWMFALPVVSLFLTTVLIVIGQSTKAASSNPVDMIRYE